MKSIKLAKTDLILHPDGSKPNQTMQFISQAFLSACSLSFLSVLCWNVFFSVFQPEISSRSLYLFLVLFAFGISFSYLYFKWKSVLCWSGFFMIFCFVRFSQIQKVISTLGDAYQSVVDQGIKLTDASDQLALSGTGIISDLLHRLDALISHVLFLSSGEWNSALAAAILTIPILLIWAWILAKRKGMFLSALLVTVPVFTASCAGYLPDPLPVWLLLFAFFFYLTAAGTSTIKSGILILTSLAIVSFTCYRGGTVLEHAKSAPDGWYMKSRTLLHESVTDPVETFVDTRLLNQSDDVNKTDSDLSQNSSANLPDASDQELPDSPQADTVPDNATSSVENNSTDSDAANGSTNQNQTAASSDTSATDSSQGTMDSKNGSSFSSDSSSGMKHLNQIARFSPAAGVSFEITVNEKPASSVYYAERYGTTYQNDYWELQGKFLSEEKLLHLCSQLEEKPEQLAELCAGISYTLDSTAPSDEQTTIKRISQIIHQELASRAVYDINPGATPDGKNFVDYFLFENQKGFCVHFATTATLMYRMLGVTARYVEGYAVPASAFQEQSDGTYHATVDGTMGHAWCQVWDSSAGRWINEEHTPAASQALQAEQAKAAGSTRTNRTSGENRENPSVFDDTAADSQQQSNFMNPVSDTINTASDGTELQIQSNHSSRRLIASVTNFMEEKGWILIPPILLVLTGLMQALIRCLYKKEKRSAARQKLLHTNKQTSYVPAADLLSDFYANILKLAQLSGFEISDPYVPETVAELSKIWPQISEKEWHWFYEQVMDSLFYHGCNREEVPKLDAFYRKVLKTAWKQMRFKERILCRYVYCIV